MKQIEKLSNRIPTPRSKVGRVVLGVLLILGGLLGFLPILGFWMIPLGLLILSHDFHGVRRFRRKATVSVGRKTSQLKSTSAAKAAAPSNPSKR